MAKTSNEQFYSKLAEQIYSDFKEVRQLPGERILCQRYVAARTTIRAALKYLRDKNLLESSQRRGNFLLAGSETEPEHIAMASTERCNIVVLVSSRQMQDQNILNFLAGVLYSGNIADVNIIIREVPENIFNGGLVMPEQLHAGIEANGYLLTFMTEGLRKFAENLLKPCVVLGNIDCIEMMERRRFVQVFLPMQNKFEFTVRKLLTLGHRRILAVRVSDKLIRTPALINEPGYADTKLDFVNISINSDSTIPRFDSADAVLAALDRHTALIVPFGGSTGLAIYRVLQLSGVEIPRRLSLIMDSGKFDYFVRVYDIANIYTSARDEAILCMEDLLRQLQTGSLAFSSRLSHFAYCEGLTVDVPMADTELKAYDAKIAWKKKMK